MARCPLINSPTNMHSYHENVRNNQLYTGRCQCGCINGACDSTAGTQRCLLLPHSLRCIERRPAVDERAGGSSISASTKQEWVRSHNGDIHPHFNILHHLGVGALPLLSQSRRQPLLCRPCWQTPTPIFSNEGRQGASLWQLVSVMIWHHFNGHVD